MKNELKLNEERMERIIDQFITRHKPFTLSVDRDWKLSASAGFMEDSSFREEIRFVICHFDVLLGFIDRIIVDNEMAKSDISDLEHVQCEKLDEIETLEIKLEDVGEVLGDIKTKIQKVLL